MFSLNIFLMKTLKGMIGNYPDFQVREYALNWYAKGKLTDENLAELDTLIENQYIVPEVPQEEMTEVETPVEEPMEKITVPTEESETGDEEQTEEEQIEANEEVVEEPLTTE